MALDNNIKVFLVHIAFLFQNFEITIYSACEVQIILLVIKKIAIPAKYLNYNNIFLKNLMKDLSKHFDINKDSINLIASK